MNFLQHSTQPYDSTADVSQPAADAGGAAAGIAEDGEITDEALLEAIVGTGTTGCAGQDSRGPASAASLGRRHQHKHH